MSFTYLRELPSPGKIKAEYPLSKEMTAIKNSRDAQIRDILTGKDDRFLVIIGPCSADSEEPVCEDVNRLAKVQEKVKNAIETMTGFTVSDVNIRIVGVKMPEDK